MLSLQIAGQGNIINNSKLANWWWYGRGGGLQMGSVLHQHGTTVPNNLVTL